MNIREYCLKLLEESGCELDVYSDNNFSKNALEDIIDYSKENEIPYSAESIAEELIKIGNEQPVKEIKHKKYQMVFDTESTTDGVEFDNFESAKEDMIDTYILWMQWEIDEWKYKYDNNEYIPLPTEEQVESWDNMIDSCTCWIAELNEETQDYYDEKMNYYFLPDEECEEIGWMHWEDLKKKCGW